MVGVVLLAACGGGDDAPAAPNTTVSDEGIGELESLAQSLLITVEGLGDPSFTDVGYEPREGGPCGIDVDAELPPSVLVGATFFSEDRGVVVLQEIRIYESTSAAEDAFDRAEVAHSCATSVDGLTTISDATDVTEDVGGDSARFITATGSGLHAQAVYVLVGDAVLTFGLGGQEPTDAAEITEIAAFGTGKVLAALEAG